MNAEILAAAIAARDTGLLEQALAACDPSDFSLTLVGRIKVDNSLQCGEARWWAVATAQITYLGGKVAQVGLGQEGSYEAGAWDVGPVGIDYQDDTTVLAQIVDMLLGDIDMLRLLPEPAAPYPDDEGLFGLRVGSQLIGRYDTEEDAIHAQAIAGDVGDIEYL